MRCGLLNLLAALSLLTCVAVVVLWVHSRVGDGWAWERGSAVVRPPGAATKVAVMSRTGTLRVSWFCATVAATASEGWIRGAAEAMKSAEYDRLLSLHLGSTDTPPLRRALREAGIDWDGGRVSRRHYAVSWQTVIVPYWLLTLALASPAAAMGVRRVRRARRASQGRCPACGYDLRATPERCPECGTTVTPKAAAETTEAAS